MGKPNVKTIILAATTALSIGGAYAAEPDLAANAASAAPTLVAVSNADSVLLDQTTGGNGIQILSQKFLPAQKVADTAGADAFVVPAGKTWSVTEVIAHGQYYPGAGSSPTPNEQVTFYKDAKGKPGKSVLGCSYSKIKGGEKTTGSFTMKLPTACTLQAGTYWLSVVAGPSTTSVNEWGWLDATETGPYQADWRNPGDYFGTGCTKWKLELTCLPRGQANGKNFELLGTTS